MDLRIAISPYDLDGVVLVKAMEVAKEIRPDDKKRVKTGVKTHANRRPGWVPGGSVVCWRLLGCWRMVWPAVVDGWRLMLHAGGFWPFWVPERQGWREPPPGLAVLSVASRAAGRWSAGDGWAAVIRRRSAAAIRRYLISH